MVTIRLVRRAMACDFAIVVAGENKAFLTDVANEALDEIGRLDEQLSCFNPRSEVSFVNANAAKSPVRVDPGLFELLRLAADVRRDTGGAFDVTTGPLIDLWRAAEESGEEPSVKAMEEALSKIGMERIVLDDSANSVAFAVEGVRINLGAIGKGYAVDRAASVLADYGIESALVSGGASSIRAIGIPPDGEAWNIGIRHPSKIDERVTTVQLADRAMATSGGVRQRDECVKERFEHIIDPVTGRPAEPSAVSVTVLAPKAALADALSTAFYLRGRDMAESYCRRHSDISAIIVEQPKGFPTFNFQLSTFN